MPVFTDVDNIWDFSFMWENFEYFTKLASPFTMIAIAILAVGGLLTMIVIAVRKAVKG